jgi:signal transduction histidine kinase
MTELAAAPSPTLQLIGQISSRGAGSLSPAALLEGACEAVVDTLAIDRIWGVLYDTRAGEVSEIAAAGFGLPAQSVERQPISSVPLLAEAFEAENLVLASGGRGGELTWVFAVPLVSGEGCLGFLTGERRAVPLDQEEVEALGTVGVVVAALLESALARAEAQRPDVLKSEFIALAAHELRNSVASIYGLSVTIDEHGGAAFERDRLALHAALREQAAHMRRLIEQLLDLSRFDLASIQVVPEPVRLRPRIEALASYGRWRPA